MPRGSASRRRLAAVLLTGLAGVAVSAATTAVRGVPRVAYHDEASYLLAADTFLHGRLANPTPRHPERFEAFNVLVEPTYASKYPPAQGLILAAGARLGGRPIVGVWLSVGLMAAAVTAMLLGFVPRRWALLGGVLVVAQLGAVTYWSQSYWGGAVAATGGAILVGAAAAARRRPGWKAGVGLGLGLAVLAASRPYEGFVLALVVLAATLLAATFFGSQGPPLARVARGVGPALLAVLALAFAGFCLLDYRVTGDPFELPYSAYARRIDPVPAFAGGELPPRPAWRNPAFARLYGDWLMGQWRLRSTLEGRLRYLAYRFGVAGRLIIGPLLLVPLVVGLAGARRGGSHYGHRGTRLAGAGIAAAVAAAAPVAYFHPHYLAPSVPLLFLLVVQGLRRLALLAPRKVRWRPLLAAALLVGVVAERTAFRDPVLATVAGPESLPAARAEIEERLRALGGRHLVLVTLGPHADIHRVWVANGADPEGQEVLWGWSFDPGSDRALLADYPDRQGWHVTVEERGRGLIDVERLSAAR